MLRALGLIDISISQKEFNIFFEGDRIQTYEVDSLTDSIKMGPLQFKTAQHFSSHKTPDRHPVREKNIRGPGDRSIHPAVHGRKH